jgi:hypothetical protein
MINGPFKLHAMFKKDYINTWFKYDSNIEVEIKKILQ